MSAATTSISVEKDQDLVSSVMDNAQSAFELYKRIPAEGRAHFLETIGKEMDKIREDLVAIAHKETNLPAARLNGEINRTSVRPTCLPP
jgi:alpha-ketoglutaric semialdehyde dehydrogenase